MPTDSSLQYLDPQALSKVQGLDLIARLVVEGFITGLHKSPYHGFSVEFAEHRQYMPGDPFKHVDWKLFGKCDRFYVKTYEQETNLRAWLLMDVSASMGYASPKSLTKLQYASYLAAALGHMMIMQQDAVGMLTFRDRIDQLIPARAVPGHLKILLRELDRKSLEPARSPDGPSALSVSALADAGPDLAAHPLTGGTNRGIEANTLRWHHFFDHLSPANRRKGNFLVAFAGQVSQVDLGTIWHIVKLINNERHPLVIIARLVEPDEEFRTDP